jgi:phosphatidylglycerophosphate synthase
MSSFTRALTELSKAQKPRRGVSLYSRFINRPLGRVLAAACFTLRMSPNAVTLVSALVTAAGLALVVTGPPSAWRAIAVMLLLVLGFALDSADGQVSRLTGRGSPAGEWLDHVVDSGKIVAVHASVLVALYLYVAVAPIALALPLAFQVVAMVTFAGGLLVELIKRSLLASGAPVSRDPSTLRALALLPADYGILALSFVLLAWPTVFLIVYAALFAANLVIAVLLLAKWFGELQALRR